MSASDARIAATWPSPLLEAAIDDRAERLRALRVRNELLAAGIHVLRGDQRAGGVAHGHEETVPVVRLRPIQHVIVEVVLLAERKHGAQVVRSAEDDVAMRMRLCDLAEAHQAEAVLLRLVDAVEGQDDDVGADALEIGDDELAMRRDLDARELVGERIPDMRRVGTALARDEDSGGARGDGHDSAPSPDGRAGPSHFSSTSRKVAMLAGLISTSSMSATAFIESMLADPAVSSTIGASACQRPPRMRQASSHPLMPGIS
jgi:hypothetical protein